MMQKSRNIPEATQIGISANGSTNRYAEAINKIVYAIAEKTMPYPILFLILSSPENGPATLPPTMKDA